MRMGKSEGMVTLCPAGDHVKEWPVFRQLFCFPKAEGTESAQRGPSCLQCASSSSHALGTGWMLLHPTISSRTLVKPGLGCRIFLPGKSHAALGHGCLPSRQLFTASCLSHFASCHQFAPDACTRRTRHLTPCLGSPGSSCCH